MIGASALRTMVDAARELEDADWALELHQFAVEGTKNSLCMSTAVVRVLVKAGQLENAASVLEVRTSFLLFVGTFLASLSSAMSCFVIYSFLCRCGVQVARRVVVASAMDTLGREFKSKPVERN